jgi:hypothetical protein
LEQHEWVGDIYDSDAFIKVATHNTAIASDDQSQISITTPSQVIAN